MGSTSGDGPGLRPKRRQRRYFIIASNFMFVMESMLCIRFPWDPDIVKGISLHSKVYE